MTYRMGAASLLATVLLLLTACSDDAVRPSVQHDGLQLLSATRAGGDAVTLTAAGSSFMMLLAAPDGQAPASTVYTYDESQWTPNPSVSVMEETQYYIYGYMPYDSQVNTTVTPVSGSYANGATMTLSGLPAMSERDICVVTGVQRVERPTAEKNIVEGNFGYFTGENGKNYVNLLMAHVFSHLVLNISVDATYSELRKVRLKKVKLKASCSKVDATVSLKSGKGIDGVSYSPVSETAETELAVSSDEGFLPVAPAVFALDFGYIAPEAFNGLTLESTYDVCDSKGHLLHERVSENKLSATDIRPGQQLTLQLKVVPTYLYVLSDPDSDNPSIVVSE